MREAELERTVQELGAALVVAKNRGSPGSSSAGTDGKTAEGGNEPAVLRARIDALELDLETANAHLSLERERVRGASQRRTCGTTCAE